MKNKVVIGFREVCLVIGLLTVVGMTIFNILTLAIAGTETLAQFHRGWENMILTYAAGIYLLYVGRKRTEFNEFGEEVVDEEI